MMTFARLEDEVQCFQLSQSVICVLWISQMIHFGKSWLGILFGLSHKMWKRITNGIFIHEVSDFHCTNSCSLSFSLPSTSFQPFQDGTSFLRITKICGPISFMTAATQASASASTITATVVVILFFSFVLFTPTTICFMTVMIM